MNDLVFKIAMEKIAAKVTSPLEAKKLVTALRNPKSKFAKQFFEGRRQGIPGTVGGVVQPQVFRTGTGKKRILLQ